MKLAIILGDQLFPFQNFEMLKPDIFFMSEDRGLATHFKYHKMKIAFFFSAMRTYAQQLKKVKLDYYELSDSSFFDNLEKTIKKNNIQEAVCFEISDHFFRDKVIQFFKKKKIEIQFYSSPMFLTSEEQFKSYLKEVKKPFMKTFYERQRKRLKILVDSKNKPEGGKWSFDDDNRLKIPKDLDVPDVPSQKLSEITKEVIKLVEKEFKNHPGELSHFWLPVDRTNAKKWFQNFLEERFKDFGPYEDAISSKTPFLFHSAISPLMNIGLMTPQEVIDESIQFSKKNKIPINCLEGFLRQIIGWREFVRGMYNEFEEVMDTSNYWKHDKKLSKSWYDGTTGILPLDECIQKVQKYGYLHHIERLMVVSNIMLLSEAHPKEVFKWFMEMFVDSADWVMYANVYGMGLMSDGGLFATKPYICGSNYICKMSDYKKSEWSDILDGLYWNFISNNKIFFSKNPRMAVMVGSLEKMDPDRKKKIFKLAENFKKKNLI